MLRLYSTSEAEKVITRFIRDSEKITEGIPVTVKVVSDATLSEIDKDRSKAAKL